MRIKPYRKRSKRGRVRPTSRSAAYAGVDLPMRGGGTKQLDTTPPQLRRLERRVGHRRVERIWEVMQKVEATIPEAIAYAWLEDRHYRFDFQSSQLGGLWVRGGAVVDFAIYDISHEGVYFWRIMGEHWHEGDRKQHADQLQKGQLVGIRVGGLPVVAVVDLWENDLYDHWPEVLEMAEMGEEIHHV